MSQDIRRAIRLVKFDRNDLDKNADMIGAGRGAVEKDFLISIFFLFLGYVEKFALFKDKMVFRGGTCIKKAYYPDEGRFSEDLDFTSLNVEEMDSFYEALRGLVGQDLGVTSITRVSETYKNSKGLDLRLDYTSVLGQPNHIMFNLSTSNTTMNPKRKRINVMPYFASFRPVVQAMNIREILAEKTRALLQRGKPRDVFDIWFLVSKKGMRVDPKMLREKLARSYQAAPPKKKASAAFYSHADAISKMKEITELAWKRELGGLLIKNSPSRETIVADVSKTLRRLGDVNLDAAE
jgi:predicted nucleotidyltransferase component of viral defense system